MNEVLFNIIVLDECCAPDNWTVQVSRYYCSESQFVRISVKSDIDLPTRFYHCDSVSQLGRLTIWINYISAVYGFLEYYITGCCAVVQFHMNGEIIAISE